MRPPKNKRRPDIPLAPTPTVKWEDDIYNPKNKEYVKEVAFNKNKSAHRVTQKEFNKRYDIK
jgi:hypothetical protein